MPPSPKKTYTHLPPFFHEIEEEERGNPLRKVYGHSKENTYKHTIVEALKQMHNHAKFLKDIVTKWKKFEEFKVVPLNEECTVLKNKIPQKEKDSRSFTISMSIRGQLLGRALRYLRASINLMPLSIGYW